MARVNVEIQKIELRGHPLKAIGDLNNLNHNLLGIMCSQSCPGDLVLKGFDAAKQIRDQSITVVSGFHSSMEKDIFEILLRGSQPIIHCLSKAIETYRIPKHLLPRVENGQLTIIAPDFPIAEKRITKNTSETCNKLVMDICDQVLIIHAHEGGNLERACLQNFPDQKMIYTLPSVSNEHLFKKGILYWKIE
jgi:hypothetical protein